jgi:hypothetical protein
VLTTTLPHRRTTRGRVREEPAGSSVIKPQPARQSQACPIRNAVMPTDDGKAFEMYSNLSRELGWKERSVTIQGRARRITQRTSRDPSATLE